MKYNLASNEALEINGDVYIKGVGTYDGTNADNSEVKTLGDILNNSGGMVEITYNELVTLRDNGELIPGMQYRITDYITTTTQEDTRSAGHQFDVIVTADSTNILNENARALLNSSGSSESLNYLWRKYESNNGATIPTNIYYVTNSLLQPGDATLQNPISPSATLYNDEEYTGAGHSGDKIVDVRYENGKLRLYKTDINGYSNSIDESEYFEYFENSYFKNIESWELKYCLDNDTTRFTWADSTNGKGVIYWMKDEYGNECPYDFKNIQFKRYAVTDVTSTTLTNDALNYLKNTFIYNANEQPIHFSFSSSNINTNGSTLTIDNNNYDWYYTFSTIKYNSEENNFSSTIEDASVIGVNFYNDENGGGCFNNKIEVYRNFMASDNNGVDGCCVLNNIVFNGMYEQGGYVYNAHSNHIKSQSYSNTFGNNCYYNTFGNNCRYNTFGNYCYRNTFGNNCGSNTFGNNCYYNTFGNSCYYNTFGNNFQNNTFGNNCGGNTFGNNFQNNTFGNNFQNNTFGNDCYYNTFGNDCYYNTFGNNCGGNTFGNYCYQNTFGNNIEESQFGDGVQYFSIIKSASTTAPAVSDAQSFVRWLIVENGVRYVNAYVINSTSSSSYCQNVRICQGCSGNNTSRKTFSIENINSASQLLICFDTSGNQMSGNLGNLLANISNS